MMFTNPHTADMLRGLSARQAKRLVRLMAECDEGEPFQIHHDGCKAYISGGHIVSSWCTCRPIVLRAGARA